MAIATGNLITATCPAPATKLAISGATASSYYATGYEPAKAIDGNTTTTMWNAGTFAPAWIQVDLGQAYSLSQVRLLTAQSPNGHTTHEIYGGPSPSSLTLLGTVDGSTTASQWLQLNTGATNVRYVKVLTTAGPSWIAWFEVEVYQAAQPADVEWLVTDQLGTPCMVFDKAGALLTTKRHDYLPFGEELASVVGLRSAVPGYGAADGVRQRFTSKERDNETNLDYFLARYYSSTLGRFASVDPQNIILDKNRVRDADERERLLQSYLIQPQNWDRYTYTRNNPLGYTDPNGKCSAPAGLSKGNVGICIEAFIAAPTIAGVGRGDNRDFAPNDPSKTFKVQVQGLISRSAFAWNSSLHATAGRSEILIEGLGLKGHATVKGSQSIDKEGNLHLSLQITGTNAFSGVPGAPEGHIQINVNLLVTPDGKVGIEGGGRTAFPSTGLYVYTMRANGKSAVATLGEGRETEPAALTQPLVPIEAVPPTCNCPEAAPKKPHHD
ncbi:MAG TPA: discoidin domain-containing protein [Pyrinomonadaceae bacterium]|jgi:RHS repeat-associated protein|nr:discoidin domain-containing protein [Pyrinomonadaceae bacterium]